MNNYKNIINTFITVIVVLGFGLALTLSGFRLDWLLHIEVLGNVLLLVLTLKMVIYLVPNMRTKYDGIINSNYKEALLVYGLIIICIYNILNAAADNYLDSLWYVFAASLIAVLYSLIGVFLFFSFSSGNSNIEPDKNIFNTVDRNKSINYGFFISQFIYLFSILGAISYKLFVQGYAGGFNNFVINLPVLIFILIVVTLSILRTGNLGYIKTFKIFFFNKYGDYDIRETSFSIKAMKEYIIHISFLLLFVVFILGLNMNLGDTVILIGEMSLSLIYLLTLYQLVIIQDVLILQNSILNDRFHEYEYCDNSSRIYGLISAFIGALSFLLLLNLIRL